MLLEARELTDSTGAAKAVRALHDVSFSVNRGEIVAMIGPNGAGKSTALKAVSGMLVHMRGISTVGMCCLKAIILRA